MVRGSPPIFGTSKTCALSANAQSRFALIVLDGVVGPPPLAWNTLQCPCISAVTEARHEVSPGPFKAALSAQKAFQGSETETRELLGGTMENSLPSRGH